MPDVLTKTQLSMCSSPFAFKGYHDYKFAFIYSTIITQIRRMQYADAIVYLKENNITKDDGTFYEFGAGGCSL